MKKITIAFGLVLLIVVSCKKELNILDTNNPSPSAAASEAGVISLAQGSIYKNGFYDLKVPENQKVKVIFTHVSLKKISMSFTFNANEIDSHLLVKVPWL